MWDLAVGAKRAEWASLPHIQRGPACHWVLGGVAFVIFFFLSFFSKIAAPRLDAIPIEFELEI